MPTYTVTVRRTVFYDVDLTIDADDEDDAKADAIDAADELDINEFDVINARDTIFAVYQTED